MHFLHFNCIYFKPMPLYSVHNRISNCYIRLIGHHNGSMTLLCHLSRLWICATASPPSSFLDTVSPTWRQCQHNIIQISSNIYTHLQARGQQAAGHDVADGLGLALVTAAHNTVECGSGNIYCYPPYVEEAQRGPVPHDNRRRAPLPHPRARHRPAHLRQVTPVHVMVWTQLR